MQKSVNGATSRQIWYGSQIALERAPTGLRLYYYGLGHYASRDEAGRTAFYIYNTHNDVVKLVGSVIHEYDYDAFGVERNIDAADANPWRYCGEYWEAETGSVYLRARYYSPGMGRFGQEDPVRDGANWYAYCGNSPVRYWDPSGLQDVGLRSYAESYGAKVTWSKEKGATVTFNNITESYKESVDANGTMIIEDSILDNKFGFSKNPISIVKNGDVTTIRVIVSITGNGANDTIANTRTTYRQSVMDGIIANWSGSYDSGTISVFVTDLNDGEAHTTPKAQKSLPIAINKGIGIPHVPGGAWKSYSNPGNIVLYHGDSKGDGSLFSSSDFGWVSAHEFGHSLGISDAYNVSGRSKILSIMNGFGTAAQDIDIDMMWKAYNSNSWQDWSEIGH